MKYPCLVPKRLCKVDIHIHLESEDTDEFGQPEKVLDLDLKCNFQDKARTILTAEKKLVEITGHVSGGHCPGLAHIERGHGDCVRGNAPD